MNSADIPNGSIFADDFLVERPIAQGGMGAVYLVTQKSTGRLRALKAMHGALRLDDGQRVRFENEARIGSVIHSEHVVEVIAAGVDTARNIPWLVMEYLEGETLAERLHARGSLSANDLAEIVRQTGHALTHAHAAGVVHRDLKPENIFIARSNRSDVAFTVKVLDFGIARWNLEHQDNAGSTARNSQRMGTPLWMAPEQLELGATIDGSTDLWALALIVFHALSGRLYWRSAQHAESNVMALMRELALDPIEPPSSRASRLPEGFDAWFLRCVNRDRSTRFTSTASAIEQLLRLLTGTQQERSTLDPALAATLSVPTGENGNEQRVATRVLSTPPTQSSPSIVPTRIDVQAQPFSLRRNAPWVVGAGTVFVGVALWLARTTAKTSVTTPHSAITSSAPDSGPPVGASVPSPLHGADATMPVSPESTRATASLSSAFARTLSVGAEGACAGMKDHSVRCWGSYTVPLDSLYGFKHSSLPVTLPFAASAEMIWLETGRMCFIDNAAKLRCWGTNGEGELGIGTADQTVHLPSTDALLDDVSGVAMALNHTCAWQHDGTLHCWGSNEGGKLGTGGSETAHLTPTQVMISSPVVDASASNRTTCAVTSRGELLCWGRESVLLPRSTGDHMLPEHVPTAGHVDQVAVAGMHACVRLTNGHIQCWGNNNDAALGTGDRRNQNSPTEVAGIADARGLAVGGHVTCITRADRTVWCWGASMKGMLLEDRALLGVVTKPQKVEGLADIDSVGCGIAFCCARDASGTVWCWGHNEAGQLGDGSNANRVVPAPVRF